MEAYCERRKTYTSDGQMNEAFLQCVRENHCQCVEEFIKAGADVNQETRCGRTVLTLAAEKGFDRCVDILTKGGADVNKQNRTGYTALMWACQRCDVECVGKLVEAGADVNIEDNNGYTALARAVQCGNINCVILLFAVGTRINICRPLFINRDISDEMAAVCYAAGQMISVGNFKEEVKPKLCLKYWSRKSIRDHLWITDPHRNIIYACLKLGLPASLTSYLLYNVSLDEDICRHVRKLQMAARVRTSTGMSKSNGDGTKPAV